LNAAPQLLSNHTAATATNGQIGLIVTGNTYMTADGTTSTSVDAVNEWPFIQTFDFTQGEFEVTFEKAGADETVVLDYNNADLDDFSSITLDRSSATQGAEIHLTITDNQLNIDPTSEDKVVFYVGTNTGTDYRGVSFTNGTFSQLSMMQITKLTTMTSVTMVYSKLTTIQTVHQMMYST